MEESFLLEELKWMRNRLTVLIEIAEKDKPYKSTVGKEFQQRVKQRMEMKGGFDFVRDEKYIAEKERLKIQDEL